MLFKWMGFLWLIFVIGYLIKGLKVVFVSEVVIW